MSLTHLALSLEVDEAGKVSYSYDSLLGAKSLMSGYDVNFKQRGKQIIVILYFCIKSEF